MENPSFSGDYINNRTAPSAGVAAVPHDQSRTGNVPFGRSAGLSNNLNALVSQDSHVPSNSGLNHPSGAAFMNYDTAPPPYDSLVHEYQRYKPAPCSNSQEDLVQPHITVATLEEPPVPCSCCCHHCSWMCWKRVHLTLAIIALIILMVKIMLTIFSN